MAVLVEFELVGATEDDVHRAEMVAMQRGQRVGGPPYGGCIFVTVVPTADGMRLSSAWRTEAEFRSTFEAALRPDLVEAGLAPGDPTVCRVVSMGVPGAH